MLILSRKVGEEIIISDNQTGDKLTIVLSRLNHAQARIGIEASDRFHILRKELYDAQQEREKAAASTESQPATGDA